MTILVVNGIEQANSITNDWMMRSARGECAWICPDCSCYFPEGMPDKCEHGHERCTELIQRDKKEANNGK